MTTMRTFSVTTAVIAAAALAVGGCGASDEEEIRAVAKEYLQLGQKDAARECELLTPRSEAQLTAIAGGDGTCEKALGKLERSDDPPSARAIDKAALRTRDDRAVLLVEQQPLGLRKVDGDWRIDNVLNGSLDEHPRRLPPGLSEGSDEQQVRATLKALSAAYAKRDYERACDLFSYGAEAQLFFGLLFASIGDTDATDDAPADLSCASAHRKLARLIGKKDAFADQAPPAASIDAASVSISRDRATVRARGKDPQRLIRQEGRWLLAADPETFSTARAPSARSLERCWRRAGIRLAATRAELRFAVRSTVRAIAVKPGFVSVKGDGWRLFYTLPSDGVDPGVKAILAKPDSVPAVAYVRDADAHRRVVARARACGS